ncbi:uncharacterized protein LOC126371827 [Pectinophora gossypiella]|uniref:uncharacterized protein LOC126371827 n=1 Tax=Pectinophora gossypiella TaxID=13191 RepID=UPI00214EF47A|nr:uncharacterized protein LOC126371827 [Pectinophora gossypiella]
MAASNELQTLALVSSEIDESEVKITFANQCIKAQEALANKLKEEIQRRKEICNIKKNENWKLEAEIKNAELEIQNLRLTQKTLKSSNTEMKRDLLLNKDNKHNIAERIKLGEKKYEDLWIQCKTRYESMPLVQKLMEGKKKSEMLKNDMIALESEAQRLGQAIKAKKAVLAEKDKTRVIQLAEFIVHERPATIKAIKEKAAIINDLAKGLENNPISKEVAGTITTVENNPIEQEGAQSADDNWFINNNLMMPKLQLPNIDMDVINVKLDINKVTMHTSPAKRTASVSELEKNTIKRSKADEKTRDDYISHYFNKTTNADRENDNEGNAEINYSKKKLINILEDIQIDDTETYKLVAKANIDKLQEIDVIVANKNVNENGNLSKVAAPPLESEHIEEIDLTNTYTHEVLIPPTQFLDLTQDKTEGAIQQEVEVIVHRTMEEALPKNTGLSQSKEDHKKKVSFDDSATTKNILDTSDVVMGDVDRNVTPNDTLTSQLDLSAVTEDNYMAIKDMILKKHHLDLSPQFVYAKNTNLQKRNDDDFVTSKFFESGNKKSPEAATIANEPKKEVTKVQEMDQCSKLDDTVVKDKNQMENDILDSNIKENTQLSPKGNDMERPVAGLLFSHGPQGIPDCLDISMSTTGYEEGDNDFPTCLDSSLLLSPKADLPMPMSGGNNSEVGSQDVPNFLSGFRKAGLSFFKQNLAEAQPDSNKQDQENNFNFKFGGDDKKIRGGLFSFFR